MSLWYRLFLITGSSLFFSMSSACANNPDSPDLHVTVVTADDLVLVSGDYRTLNPEPPLPFTFIERVVVLVEDTSTMDPDESQIHPRRLQVEIASLTATTLNPESCTAKVTDLQAKTATVTINLQDHERCLIRYDAMAADRSMATPVPQCRVYRLRIEGTTAVLSGFDERCPDE